jgi:hypothetical protein
VPQLHLPSGRFHPTVEKKQLEHSDVSLPRAIVPNARVCSSHTAGLLVPPARLPPPIHRPPRAYHAAVRCQVPPPRLPNFIVRSSHVPRLHASVLHLDCRKHA